MNNIDFSLINKTTANSFKSQRNLIRRIASGATELCSTCHQPLMLTTPRQGKESTNTGIHCAAGCTDIELDFLP